MGAQGVSSSSAPASNSSKLNLGTRALPGPLHEIWRFARRARRNVGAMLGLTLLSIVVLVAIFANQLAPYDPYFINVVDKFQPPGLEHPFGTDDLGRDVFTRVVIGTRISFRVAALVLLIAGSLGVTIGTLAGYQGGFIDEFVMRIADIFLSFPSFLLAMAVVAALGPSINNAIVAIGIAWWPRYARLIRGQVLVIKQFLYIESARAIGASGSRIMFLHLLPNCLSPLLVQLTMDAGNAIIITSSLSFVGLGAIPPMPEWGAMIAQSRAYMLTAWWIPVFPGLAIAITVAGYMFLGDGLRDLLDPTLRGRRFE
jgi:peptide/nickel transport system permease protein